MGQQADVNSHNNAMPLQIESAEIYLGQSEEANVGSRKLQMDDSPGLQQHNQAFGSPRIADRADQADLLAQSAALSQRRPFLHSHEAGRIKSNSKG